ncbi:MAG: ABC transporter substrate-binding protein, partial [Oscillospiraceae bacterium]
KTIGDSEQGYRYHPTVSSGAYKFISFDRSSKQAVLEANPLFKGNYEGQKPQIQKIIMKSVTTANQKDELSSGAVNLLTQVSGGTEIEAGLALVDEGKAKMTAYDRAGYGKLIFACDFGPTQFVKVRQAIAHLIDGPEFAKQYSGGYGKVVKGMYGMGQWMYQQKQDEIERELDDYEYDVKKAIDLLVDDGWTKNASGGAYTSGVRYKDVDGSLMPLSINWANTTPNPVTDLLNTILPSAFEQAGMKLNATTVDFNVLLQNIQRQGIDKPVYHMYNLATGFEPVFDPWYYYNTDPKYMGVYNSNFLVDDKLFQLAKELRETDQTDTDAYAAKWVTFQKRWNEVLPDIPLYSDVFHDFYSPNIRGYGKIDAFWTWTQQILYCHVGKE